MFEQTFIDHARGDARKPWPVAASLAGQTAFVAALLAVPLFQTARLTWMPPPPLLLMPIKPVVVKQVKVSAGATSQAPVLRPMFRPVFAGPTRIPSRIVTAPDPDPGSFLPQLTGAGAYADPLGGIAAPTVSVAAGPTAVAQPVSHETTKPTSLKVSGGVQAAKLIYQVKPPYPQLARAARVSGTVRLQAVIAADGRIRNLQLISGPSLLVAAALQAVKDWKYEPTLLNGTPVEVITSIEVNFTLN